MVFFANFAFPALAFQWPLMWLLLPLVIVLEASFTLGELPFPTRFGLATRSNLVSTALGVPAASIATALFFIASCNTGDALGLSVPAALNEFAGGSVVVWDTLMSNLGATIPWLPVGLIFSVLIERRVVEKRVHELDLPLVSEADIRRWILLGNCCSYTALLIATLALVVASYR